MVNLWRNFLTEGSPSSNNSQNVTQINFSLVLLNIMPKMVGISYVGIKRKVMDLVLTLLKSPVFFSNNEK